MGAAADSGSLTWRAYPRAQAAAIADASAVHARERIVADPWFNAKGVSIAKNVDDLHSAKANLTKETLLGRARRACLGELMDFRPGDPWWLPPDGIAEHRRYSVVGK